MVFVEWPLAATMTQNEELAALAKLKNAKTIVGLQARADPLVLKLKQLVSQLDYSPTLTLTLPPQINEGKIGKVLSSNATGAIMGLPDVWPESWTAYHDIESGGNVFTIYFGHCMQTLPPKY